MAKKKLTKSKFKDELYVVPPNSFVIFRTYSMQDLTQSLSHCIDFLEERAIKGVVLDYKTEIELLSNTELAQMGLQRIPRLDVH